MSAADAPTADLGMLRALFDIAPYAMLVVDAGGHIVLSNAQAERMFGYAPGTLRQRSLEALLPAALREIHAAHRHEYVAHPQMRTMGPGTELQATRRDGHAFPVEVGLSPVTLEQGICTVAVIRDISATHRFRQARERTRLDRYREQISQLALQSPDYELALQEIPALVAAALEVPVVAIFSTSAPKSRQLHVRAETGLDPDAGKRLVAALNAADFAQRMYGSGSLEAVTLASMCEDGYAGLCAQFAATGFGSAAMVPVFGRFGIEPLALLVAMTPDAVDFDETRLSFLQSVSNLLVAAVRRHRMEEQLAHAQRLDAIGQLTGGVAHDFNNLLTIISGNLQLLEAELPSRPGLQDSIDNALLAVERGSKLTRKLLVFARRQPLQPRAVVPRPLLDELAQMLRRTLGETISVAVDCAVSVPDVYADATELDTALVNLALNARDAMPRGGRLILSANEVAVAERDGSPDLPSGSYVAIAVSDTGVGMPAEVKAHALEPFFTTKKSGSGSGLGLSMVYGFAAQSGGTVTIDSRLGYGTRIELLLPVATIGARAVSGPVLDSVGEPTRGKSILVVEDEPDVRTIATRFLTATGHEVFSAADAREALRILDSPRKVDLLFTDVVLGAEMGGVELAHAARQRIPDLPVLLTSGYLHGGALGGEDATGFDVLRKPYRRDELSGAIQRLLADG